MELWVGAKSMSHIVLCLPLKGLGGEREKRERQIKKDIRMRRGIREGNKEERGRERKEIEEWREVKGGRELQ